MPDHCPPRNFEFERERPWVRFENRVCFLLDRLPRLARLLSLGRRARHASF